MCNVLYAALGYASDQFSGNFIFFFIQGAINLLLAVYKKELRELGGYLTNGSMVGDGNMA